MNPLLLTDFYKIHHTRMYPDNMTKLYSNLTPRRSRIDGVNKVVVFGIQYFILEYLIKAFNRNFFYKNDRIQWERQIVDGNDYGARNPLSIKKYIIEEYTRHCQVDIKHIEALWDLEYLPIEIKALPEGTLCPIGVPMLTITNTHPDFAWLVNYLETLLSCTLWQAMTSATIAHEYKKLLTHYAKETDEKNVAFVDWQGHDFSMRGMSSVESAILSGMGHLLSFTGTDTIPAIYQLESSYNASGLIGASVPATEHSVMCMGQKEDEIKTFERLLKLYPTGILSVVSDTWDLWKVLTEYLPTLKDQILAREGKLVIRPDSGDPVDIICGCGHHNKAGKYMKFIPIQSQYEGRWEEITVNQHKGVIELLWDIFGGTTNEQGYKVLDPHIGAIYGDSITLSRAKEICERLKAKGFASTNIVLGIGSYTYQYNTRDTFGFAMKATYGEIDDKQSAYPEAREIYKDPITDDGTKKSKKGLLQVKLNPNYETKKPDIIVKDQCTKEEERLGLLETVFKDGKLVKEFTLQEIRDNLKKYE